MNRAADDRLPEKLAGIVKLHAGLAVGSALIPIPGGDIAATVANIWTMYVRINKELGIPFSENIVKSVAAGVVTNLGGGVVGTLAIGTVLKFVPGLGSLGGAAVMATTAYAITIVSGIVYMRAVAMLAGAKAAENITADEIKRTTEDLMRDKTSMKEMFKSAKESYKG